MEIARLSNEVLVREKNRLVVLVVADIFDHQERGVWIVQVEYSGQRTILDNIRPDNGGQIFDRMLAVRKEFEKWLGDPWLLRLLACHLLLKNLGRDIVDKENDRCFIRSEDLMQVQDRAAGFQVEFFGDFLIGCDDFGF